MSSVVEQNGGAAPANSEDNMPPQEQEDSPKVPLTGTADDAKEQVKPAAGNGDASIDITGKDEDEEEEFKGLTKEELLEYSKKPFWIRLRILLMFLFWAGWVVMLVLAILIIIQAPRCEPPPTLQWVQESPILQVDVNSHTAEGITTLMEKLGITSFFIPKLISPHDYFRMNTNLSYVAETIRNVVSALSNNSYKAVTDYVPNPVKANNPWVTNDSLIDSATLQLKYSSPELEPALQGVFEYWYDDEGVAGFLVSEYEITNNEGVTNLTTQLNANMQEKNIVVSDRTVDMTTLLNTVSVPGTFKSFVMDNYEDWTYYMYNPVSEAHRAVSPSQMPAITLCLMTLPGTPLMQVTTNLTEFEHNFGDLIRAGVKLRQADAIKFGETQFVNSTSENVIAYTRTQKGTPGYAVVINIGHDSENVDFSDLMYVPETGTLAYSLNSTLEENSKMVLNSITVGPHEGKVVQFVAKYE